MSKTALESTVKTERLAKVHLEVDTLYPLYIQSSKIPLNIDRLDGPLVRLTTSERLCLSGLVVD